MRVGLEFPWSLQTPGRIPPAPLIRVFCIPFLPFILLLGEGNPANNQEGTVKKFLRNIDNSVTVTMQEKGGSLLKH